MTPEDIYRILRIPIHGPRVSYDTVPREGIEALRAIFQRELAIRQAITWDEFVHTYGPRHRLALVLAIFISCFLVPDRGQHGLECGWGVMLRRMLDAPERFGWGECMLTHMFFKIHEIVYHERKSMATGIYVLQVWAWEHLPITRPIFEDAHEPTEPYICRYRGQITQAGLGKTDYWRTHLDGLVSVMW